MTREMVRPLRPGAVGPRGRREELVATPEECAALAVRLGLLALESLTATIDLSPAKAGTSRAKGTLQARVVQECVVTLDPVPQSVEAPIDWRLLPLGQAAPDELDDGPDEIEAEPDGTHDLGEALVQELALALDPYPRAPDAELPSAATDGKPSPFAALRALGAIPKPG